jgi:hypothetical protein
MTKYDILILACIISFLATYNLWSVIPITGFFSKGQAVSISLATYIILSLVRDFKQSRLTQRFAYFLFFISINNVLDNLVFNPYAIQWNEYLFAVIALLASIYITRNTPTNERIKR